MEKVIDKFAEEQDMLDAYIKGEFTALDIATVIAPDEVKDKYKEYCSLHKVGEGEESAKAFLDWWYDEDSDREPSDDELLGEELPSFEDASREDETVFSEWNKDVAKITKMSISESARDITLWRWKNPTSTNKQKCALDINVPITEVEEWWNVPDWINGYVGGHFHPVNMDKKELKAFLVEACRKTIEA